MNCLILIYLSNRIDALQKIVSTHKILTRQFLFIFQKSGTRIVKNKLFRISINNRSQLKLWSDLLKNTCKGVNFQKSWITCNFSSKLHHKYLSWILARVFWTSLFQSNSFSEHFSVFFYFYLYPIHEMHLKQTFSFTFSHSHSHIKVFSEEKNIDHIEHLIAEHTL